MFTAWRIRRLEKKIRRSEQAIHHWRDKDAEWGKGRYTGIIIAHDLAIDGWQRRIAELKKAARVMA